MALTQSASDHTDRRPQTPHNAGLAERPPICLGSYSETAPKRSERSPRVSDAHRRAVQRLALIEVGIDHSPVGSMKWCMRKRLRESEEIKYHCDDKKKKFSVGNLFLCRSVFCCYCRNLRGIETSDKLRKGLLQARDEDMSAGMLTLTIASDSLCVAQQKYYLSRSFKLLRRRIGYAINKANRDGKVYFSWSYDVTFRKSDFSPHLHLHIIALSNVEDSILDSVDFNDLWVKCLKSSGYIKGTYGKSAYYEPVDLKSDVSTYIFKVSQEINSKETKTGHNSYSFLELCKEIYDNTPDDRAVYQYRAIIEAFRGSRFQNVGIKVGKLYRKYDELNPVPKDTDTESSTQTLNISWLSHSIITSFRYGLPHIASLLMNDFNMWSLIIKATDDAANQMANDEVGGFDEVVGLWYNALASFH